MNVADVATRLERALGNAAVRARSGFGSFAERPLVSPASEAELVEALRLAATDRLRVLPLGFGSKLGWRPALPDRGAPDLLLSTRRLAGIVAFEPGDGTLTAWAGSTLAELAHAARAGDLCVTPTVSDPSHATLGGVLAAGQSGIERTLYGPARHHVLGMRVALADGSIARTGGRLVKNVTGFDLQRLYCGSHGTLCVILEATLRLFSSPRATVALRGAAASVAAALATAQRLRDLPIRPWTVLVEHAADGTELHLVLAGREEVVAWETEQALAVLQGADVVTGDAALERANALVEREREHGAWPHVRVACRPSQLREVAARWAPRAIRLRLQPGVALLDAWLVEPAADLADGPPRTPELATRTMDALRSKLDPQGLFALRSPHSVDRLQ